MAKVTIDTEKCIGCGLCEQACPEVFEIDDYDGYIAKIKIQEYSQYGEQIKEAAEQCPVEAIKIE